MRVLITGANGFIGKVLGPLLQEHGHSVYGAIRPGRALSVGIEPRPAGILSADGDWRSAVKDCEAVVHLAARVHVMHDEAADPLAEFRAANTAGTLRLAEQAAAAGTQHVVFLSSIKANGEETHGTPFGPGNAAPADPYGVSKLEAEQELKALAERTGLAITVLRPPLVYGPNVKGNFRSLVRLVDRGIPLPLGLIRNRRSLISVNNLTDAVRACLERPPAPGQCQVFTLADSEAVSSPELVRRLARALGRPARLLPVAPALMRLAGAMIGKAAAVQRLTASLEVEGETIAAALGWTPPQSLDQGLEAVARWWRHQEKTS